MVDDFGDVDNPRSATTCPTIPESVSTNLCAGSTHPQHPCRGAEAFMLKAMPNARDNGICVMVSVWSVPHGRALPQFGDKDQKSEGHKGGKLQYGFKVINNSGCILSENSKIALGFLRLARTRAPLSSHMGG
ncbi:hypothetical protein ColLi_09841 [Colletotrichum liriopes]|uniref:Uncharacterized protein n=1 Tax=Colletotrichum liriopes TaxID=708192 RepID=A0AA37GTI2_9PEZI|nr:hypothetical protein ColLi_09841 [Colletotrichum liriopes]